MSYLDFNYDKEALYRIKSTMRRRGYFVDPEDYWQVYGPYQGTNYRVFTGPVYEGLNVVFPCTCKQVTAKASFCKRHKGRAFMVAIYPRGVYATDDWTKIESKDKIPTKRR